MKKLYKRLKTQGLSAEQEERIKREMKSPAIHTLHDPEQEELNIEGLYERNDLNIFYENISYKVSPLTSLQTLDDLLAKDKKREEDGFPRRIKLGKYIKPAKDNKEQVVVVPTTTEPKFYHDSSVTEEEDSTGGSGDGDEGDVIAEQPADPEEGEGEGTGAGQGDGESHEIGSDAFDLGKVLTEKFELPNLKVKGKKRSFNKYIYDLTDQNRGFGQVLDKKATLRKIVETNIVLGNIDREKEIDPSGLLINPQDHIYKILSKEKDFESQAVVFFIRDYSGSMQGKPTEVVVTQHLYLYSWLMFQYQNNVTARFILHDTEAKEVPDFYTYYRSQVAGGTSVYPSYELVNKIVEEEQLLKENNIYVFHGTDGDDWEESGEKAIVALRKMISYSNRTGITIARNSWSGSDKETTVEAYVNNSNLLKEKNNLLRMHAMNSEEATEDMIIEGIRKLIS
jgi:uncharacterized sporulation protein YeaH/YhbH (DUF444 family)